MEKRGREHKKYYTSPLSDAEVNELAKLAVTGENPTLRDISGTDAGRIMGAAAMMIRKKKLKDGQKSKPIKDQKAVLAGNIRSLSLPNGDHLMIDVLQSLEMQVVFQLLGAALSELSRVCYRDLLPGATHGWASSDAGQAHHLCGYLQQKALGDPVINNRGVRVGWQYPAQELHPNATQLSTRLRIWANSLTRTEAMAWVDAGQPVIKARLRDIAEAGRIVDAVYGQSFRRIGIRLDDPSTDELFGLPGLYPADIVDDFEDEDMPPRLEPDDEGGRRHTPSSP